MPADHNLRPVSAAAVLTDDELDELVWMMTHPAAVVTMSRRTLRVLLEAYGRECARVAGG